MNRTDEIRQRCDAGRTVRITDVKYLLGEIDRLNDAHEAMLRDLQMRSAQVEALKRERDACKADLKSMADWYRDSVCDDGICGWCKQDADHGLDGDANECAGFYKNDCFEWRGPQEGNDAQN